MKQAGDRIARCLLDRSGAVERVDRQVEVDAAGLDVRRIHTEAPDFAERGLRPLDQVLLQRAALRTRRLRAIARTHCGSSRIIILASISNCSS